MVVASTSSPHAIVGAEELAEVMRARGGRPLLLLDIAVPRDVEHACGDMDGVTLVDIDVLQQVVERNLEVREAEARRAEAIVEQELEHFAGWMSSLDVLPTIRALRAHGEDIVERVLGENAGRWESASARDLARVEAIAKAVMNRLLHEPTIRLKSVGHGRQQLARELFGLEEGTADVVEQPDAENVRALRRPR
jgi:glutamyl-tRNA reductase